MVLLVNQGWRVWVWWKSRLPWSHVLTLSENCSKAMQLGMWHTNDLWIGAPDTWERFCWFPCLSERWMLMVRRQGAAPQLGIQSPDGQRVRLCTDLSETKSRIVSVVSWLRSPLISAPQQVWVWGAGIVTWKRFQKKQFEKFAGGRGATHILQCKIL